MEPTELFRKTLSFFLEEKGRGSQKDLSDRTGVPSSLINDFIKGRKAISELKKNDISKSFGFEYEEFIALGRRLWQSDEPWLWVLRAIHLDEQRFRDLLNDSGITETRFKGIFNVNKSLPLMPDEKEKILEATGFTEKDFLDFGRREILKNPKMKWDRAGMVRQIGTRTTMPYKHENPEASDEQSSELDTITQEHFEIVKKFRYKELAKEINEDLLKINDPEVLEEVAVLIRGIALGMGFEFKLLGKNSRSTPSSTEGNLKNGTDH